MKGKIIVIDNDAKLEIWADEPKERDIGGFCHACDRYFYSISSLVRHFVDKHEGKRVSPPALQALGIKK